MPSTRFHLLAGLLVGRVCLKLRGWSFVERDEAEVSPELLLKADACWSVVQGLGMADTMRAAYFQTVHFTLALKTGVRSRVVRALAVEAAYLALSGARDYTRTQRMLARAASLAGAECRPYETALLTLISGMAAFLAGYWAEAVEKLEIAERELRTRCAGVAWELATARLMTCVSLFFSGAVRELNERLPGLLGRADARGDRYEATDLRIRIAHVARLAEDRPDAAAEELRNALACWPSDTYRLQHWWGFIGGIEIALYTGDGTRAWSDVQQAWPGIVRSLLLRVQYVRIESLHHRACAALGAAMNYVHGSRERSNLLRRARSDADRIRRERTAWGDGLAGLIQAAVSNASGVAAAQVALQLGDCEQQFRAAGMELFATAAGYRRWELTGRDPGAAQSAEWMIRQGIKEPGRFVNMLAPGFQ